MIVRIASLFRKLCRVGLFWLGVEDDACCTYCEECSVLYHALFAVAQNDIVHESACVARSVL